MSDVDPEAQWSDGLQPGYAVAIGLYHLALSVATDVGMANPDHDFFLLGGPMTGYQDLNLPAMTAAAEHLREQGYNVVLAGCDDEPREVALARAVVICALPTCVGGIFLPDWHCSQGCELEIRVLHGLGKQVLVAVGDPIKHLVAIDDPIKYMESLRWMDNDDVESLG